MTTFNESNTVEAYVRDLTYPPTPSQVGRGVWQLEKGHPLLANIGGGGQAF
jgi:hypothetical protein